MKQKVLKVNVEGRKSCRLCHSPQLCLTIRLQEKFTAIQSFKVYLPLSESPFVRCSVTSKQPGLHLRTQIDS
jgi:hypothetical protein